MSLNKVLLIGRLGQDPKMHYVPSGQPVANFSIATDESYTSKDGQRVERTEWHRISIFGKLAEIAGQYLHKGSKVYIEGRNQTREWEKDGIKRYTTEIIVDMRGQMQMLDSQQQGGQQAQQQYQQPQQQNQQSPHNHAFDDDPSIPF